MFFKIFITLVACILFGFCIWLGWEKKKFENKLNWSNREKESLNHTIDKLNDYINSLNDKLEVLAAQNTSLAARAFVGDSIKNDIEKLNEIKDSGADEKNRLKEELETLRRAVENAQKEKDNWDKELIEIVAERKMVREKLDGENESGWRFDLSGKEMTLIQAIDSICGLYLELSVDLRKIEWSKVWMPKLQEWNKLYGLSKCGIYRLSVVGGDGEEDCYIGQAVDVKDRWYTHCKKILGVEKVGNEKLYRKIEKPDKLRWEILEVVNDRNKLDEREKFWIEFYGAKLNIR